MSTPTPEEVERQIQELTELRKRARNWQFGIIITVTAIFIFGIGFIISSVVSLAKTGPKQKEFIAELQAGLKRQVVPELKLIAQRSMNDVKHDVEIELKKVNSRSPELIKALNKEVVVLQKKLPERGEKVLEATLGKELKSREGKIHTMFPDATEEQVSTMVVQLMNESHASMDHLSHTLFRPHIESLSSITHNIDVIKKTEKLDPKTDVATWETALLVVDVLRDDIKTLAEPPPTELKKTSAKMEVK